MTNWPHVCSFRCILCSWFLESIHNLKELRLITTSDMARGRILEHITHAVDCFQINIFDLATVVNLYYTLENCTLPKFASKKPFSFISRRLLWFTSYIIPLDRLSQQTCIVRKYFGALTVFSWGYNWCHFSDMRHMCFVPFKE